ncbi:MAG: polysaccharide deacetylase family protein [Candidatus Margulisiibacteriota bacterium]
MQLAKNILANICLLFFNNRPGGARVLMYHKVVPDINATLNLGCGVDVSEFRSQLERLKKMNYNFLSLRQFVEMKKADDPALERSLLLTFDDGAREIFLYAYPVLKDMGIPAVFFLPAGYIGENRVFWWDRLEFLLLKTKKEMIKFIKEISLKTFEEKRRAYAFIETYIRFNLTDDELDGFLDGLKEKLGVDEERSERSTMNWDEVQKMRRDGFEFGAHTMEHVWLSRVGADRAAKEILESAKALENRLGEKTVSFAYPYGDFNEISLKIVKSAGFEVAFSVIDGVVKPHDDDMLIKRVGVGCDSPEVFAAKITSLYPRIIKGLRSVIKK